MEFTTRFAPPGKYDKAPYKTIYRLSKDDNWWGYYIQLGKNEEEPDWQPMGYFFERAFEENLKQEEFINECIRLFDHNTNNPLSRIGKILKEKG